MNLHGGNVFEIADKFSVRVDELTDFSSSINPLGFPPWLREEISRTVSLVIHYPDIMQRSFIIAVSRYHGIPEEMILGGNGAGELIDLIPGIVKPDRVIIPVPSFGEYSRSCRNYNTEEFLLTEENNFILDPCS